MGDDASVSGKLDEHQRLVVGVRDALTPVPLCQTDYSIRAKRLSSYLVCLTDGGVYAEIATPVAPDRSDGQKLGARLIVIDRFLLDCINMRGYNSPVAA